MGCLVACYLGKHGDQFKRKTSVLKNNSTVLRVLCGFGHVQPLPGSGTQVVYTAQGSAIAEEAIKRIAKLYGIEKEARANPPGAGLLYVQKVQNLSSMIWKTGCTPSCLKYPANHLWLKRSVMP